VSVFFLMFFFSVRLLSLCMQVRCILSLICQLTFWFKQWHSH